MGALESDTPALAAATLESEQFGPMQAASTPKLTKHTVASANSTKIGDHMPAGSLYFCALASSWQFWGVLRTVTPKCASSPERRNQSESSCHWCYQIRYITQWVVQGGLAGAQQSFQSRLLRRNPTALSASAPLSASLTQQSHQQLPPASTHDVGAPQARMTDRPSCRSSPGTNQSCASGHPSMTLALSSQALQACGCPNDSALQTTHQRMNGPCCQGLPPACWQCQHASRREKLEQQTHTKNSSLMQLD